MPKNFLNIFLVVISTIGSRILGLLRDILIFASFGTTALNSAFILAFTLPNLFRRLLGEGALNAALVPTLTEELEENGEKGAFLFINQVLTRVLFILLIVVATLGLTLVAIDFIPGLNDRWYLGVELGIVLLPYLVLICLAAIIHAGLSVLKRFTLAALSPVWLNLSMIVSLGGFGFYLGESSIDRVAYLCGGVIIGGIFQLVLPAVSLNRKGWHPAFDLKRTARMNELVSLYLPGLAGAAIYQINIVVTRFLAFWLDDAAVSILYLANRLLELPLGVFAIAVTTVLFPSLSQFIARNDLPGFTRVFHQGVRMITAVTIPAAMGLIILREPILNLLFVWGMFKSNDVMQTMPVVFTLALALPFYAIGGFTTRGFYALKDTRTPYRLAILNFIVNLFFSLILMGPLGVIGLAIANVLASVVHTFVLYWMLGKKIPTLKFGSLALPIIKIIIAGFTMSCITAFFWSRVHSSISDPKLAAIIAIFIIMPTAIIFYFSLLWVFKFDELKELWAFIISVFKRRKTE